VQPADSCVSTVRVTPAAAVLRYGNSVQLSATLGCNAQAANVRWSSVDTTIAFVDSLSGLMRARTVTGTTSIIAVLASDRSIQGSMVVQVTP
jgi:uncharacterized protein YjdB